ncbi:carboxymuconolactone decarboxylase family protein [Papillibacter cinnamivorans]|uniref:Alkylhydroperoxidase AhpD family core domain-containing protein n=1 Tax=Papillibacter cinnamivorans DSM 12816 TaxID=1122930 RepID=A0A1W2CLG0_9FIRM|nr:carboxymuconolactone decarboxylase family protein [Papillibacter cinnamivorans]SMC85722.1 alkylhydroperoxidase AhpD family core domain-containing protein [Papillibacter cinnamivorans DSM 12816]
MTAKQNSAGRKLYSVGEAYMIFFRAMYTIPGLRKGRRDGMLSGDFMERLMLAVTEVNQCALCSYAHTKMALESGMSREEIEALLSGDPSGVKPEEMTAYLFAQHYADSRGRPSEEAWNSVVRQYGKEKSAAILGAIRMIMMGNAYGIPLGSFLARFSGKASDPRSSIWYEIAMLATFAVFIPCVIVNALVAALLRLPLIAFS